MVLALCNQDRIKPLDEMSLNELDDYIDAAHKRIDMLLFLMMSKNINYTNASGTAT